jgi:hypothetical protein
MPVREALTRAHIRSQERLMSKDNGTTEHDLRDGLPMTSIVPPHAPLAGGHAIFAVDEGPNIASPSQHTPSGQTSHE